MRTFGGEIKEGANSARILKERIPEIRRLVCREVGRGVDPVHWIMVEILQKCKFQRRHEPIVCVLVKLALLYLSRVTSDPGWFKINSSKFYYCEKSENLHSCSFICWL
jgi:hypothetical protein